MREIQKLSLLLDELGDRYGIANLKLPAHGAVGLRLKDGSELYLEHAAELGRLYAYMPLLPLPAQEPARMAMMSRMLEFNFLGVEDIDGALSINRSMATVHISLSISTLQFDALDRALQQLIAVRASLVKKLKAEPTADTGPSTKARHSSSTLLAAFKQGASHGQAS